MNFLEVMNIYNQTISLTNCLISRIKRIGIYLHYTTLYSRYRRFSTKSDFKTFGFRNI
jgi:hypothetical protein